jgi:hypothetical protein
MKTWTKPGTKHTPKIQEMEDCVRIAYSDAAEWGTGWILISDHETTVSSEPWSTKGGVPGDQITREALGALRAVKELHREDKNGRLLLLVDAGALVQAVYKGWSPNAAINAFVEACDEYNVAIAHVPGIQNIADGVSRGKSPPSTEEINEALFHVVNHVKGSDRINRAARSTW